MMTCSLKKYCFKKSGIAMLLASALPFSVMAHEEPIEAGWCADGEIRILATLNLTRTLLEKFKNAEEPVCSVYQRSCGQFDDDYDLSFKMAGSICHSLSSDELEYRSRGDHRTVRPIFHAPVTMKNSEDNHHDIYSIDQGVQFSCGYCFIEAAEPQREETEAVEAEIREVQ